MSRIYPAGVGTSGFLRAGQVLTAVPEVIDQRAAGFSGAIPIKRVVLPRTTAYR
jgi:hypothetical protein